MEDACNTKIRERKKDKERNKRNRGMKSAKAETKNKEMRKMGDEGQNMSEERKTGR